MFERSENSRIIEEASSAALGVSVVICCHNSAKLLPPTLEHLRAQQVHPSIPWEVIVVDNASTDATAEVARTLWPADAPAPLRIVHEPRLGLSNARRRGLDEARCEIVSFVDDDNWVASDWMNVASEVISADSALGAVGAVTSAVCEIDPPAWFETFKGWYAVNAHEATGPMDTASIRVLGAGLSVRKEAWVRLAKSGYSHKVSDRLGRKLFAGGDSELVMALKLSGWQVRADRRLRIRHFIPAARLNWTYIRRVVRGYFESSAILDAYYFVQQTGEASLLGRFRQNWMWHLANALKSLCARPLKLLPALYLPMEGDETALEAERHLGRIVGLVKLRGRYSQLRREIQSAPWRTRINERPGTRRADVAPAGIGAGRESPERDPASCPAHYDREIGTARVSTIIPAYNSEVSVAAAIDSALAQEFEGNEIIVTNDGSTDGTARVLDGYGSAIRLVEQPNRGPSAARNAGAAIARGEYLAFLDADDIWLPGKLARMVRALAANPKAVLAFSDYIPIDETGTPGEPSRVGRAPTMDDLLAHGWAILPSTVVMRCTVFNRCGGFCEEFKRPGGDDPYMWLLAREHGEFVYVPEPLVLYDCPVLSELADKYATGRAVFARLVRARYGQRAESVIASTSGYFAALLVAKASAQMSEGRRVAALLTLAKAFNERPMYFLTPRVLRARKLSRIFK